MTNANEKLITETMDGLFQVYVSDRKLAIKMNVPHLRGGKITATYTPYGCKERKQMLGLKVQAFGYDELDNLVALTADGFVKQFH